MRQSVVSLGGSTFNRFVVRNPCTFQHFTHFPAQQSSNAGSVIGWRYGSSDASASASLMNQRSRGGTQDDRGDKAGGSDEEFRTLDLVKSRSNRFDRRKRRERKEVPPPRYLKMPLDQDWASVWPTARTFHPASVPLPLHQGYVPAHKAPPGKFANLELMKISNFLHLTPPAIKRHCEALKKFCTPWPKELKEDYVVEQLLPVEIVTNDYCHSLPNIRDIRARIVTLQVPLVFLNLDHHGKDKMLRLVGERYDGKTGLLTIVTQNCPLRKQNYDHAKYLLTALYHESLNEEKWEDEKGESDMEKYIWEGSVSQKKMDLILGTSQGEGNPVPLAPTVEQYKEAVVNLHNHGEDPQKVEDYGKSVRQLFNLPISPSS